MKVAEKLQSILWLDLSKGYSTVYYKNYHFLKSDCFIQQYLWDSAR